MEPLSDFAVKTHAELLRLAGEAAKLDYTRGYDSRRRWDRLHAEINDHLDQLADASHDEPATTATTARMAVYASVPVNDRTREPLCGLCGRPRYVIHDMALACTDCDQP